MCEERVNTRYLPGAAFPENLEAVIELEACLDGARDILVAVPSHGFRETLETIKPLLTEDARICWATKGFELHTGKLPHVVAAEVLGAERPVAVLSGPTFAREVGDGLPTALTIAANDAGFAQDLAVALSGENFRAYTSDDMIGVEVGGAVKNVLAIGAGMSDGLGFGANSRVALITRGLVEMTRLGVALGARRETFMGLAGMGDLRPGRARGCRETRDRNADLPPGVSDTVCGRIPARSRGRTDAPGPEIGALRPPRLAIRHRSSKLFPYTALFAVSASKI
jgi:glycerol-3-phosphate dehydrogenase (NAD(P)+)